MLMTDLKHNNLSVLDHEKFELYYEPLDSLFWLIVMIVDYPDLGFPVGVRMA